MTITIKQPQGTSAQPMSVEPPPQDKTPANAEGKTLGEAARGESKSGLLAKKADGSGEVKKSGPIKDEIVTQGVRLTSDTGVILHDAPPVAPPTADAKLQAALDLFNGLAAQLGQAQGTPAAKFGATVAVPQAVAGLPELALGREQTAAIVTVKSLVAQGALKLPPALMQKLEARFALVTGPAPQTAATALTPAQQQAAQRLAAAFLPVMKGMQHGPGGRFDWRGAALARFDPKKTIALDDEEAMVALPAPLRRSISLALGFEPEAESTGESSGLRQETGPEPAPGDTFSASRSAQRADEDPLTTLEPITIPGPEVVAFESIVSGSIMNLAGADVEMLCQIMMMQLARDSELELRDTLKEMQEVNDQKKVMREHISKMKAQEAKMKSALRKEYDDRCALPKTSPDHIDPAITKFEDFCESQKLSMLSGGLDPTGDNIAPKDAPVFGISPNKTRYPQATAAQESWNGYTITDADRGRAQQLGITPEQACALRRTWDADVGLQAKFGASFEEWIVRSQEDGGVGLALNPADSQSGVVTAYLASHDPAVVTADAGRKYGLSQEQMTTLYQHYVANVGDADRAAAGGTFDRWLASLGMRPSMPDRNRTEMNRYLARFERDAEIQRLGDVYGISSVDLHSLKQVYDALDEKPATFEEFLTQNVHLSDSDAAGNEGRIGTYFVELSRQVSAAAPPAAPTATTPTYSGPDPVQFDASCDAAQGHASNPLSADEQYIVDALTAIEAKIPSALKGSLTDVLKIALRSLFAGTHGDKGATTQKVTEFLTGLIDAQSPRAMIDTLQQFASDGQFTSFCDPGSTFTNACNHLASQLRGDPSIFNDVRDWFRGRTIICQNDLDEAKTTDKPRGNYASWMSNDDGSMVLYSAQGSDDCNHVSYSSNGNEWHLGTTDFSTAYNALDNVFANIRGAERERGPSEPEGPPSPPQLSETDKTELRGILRERREGRELETLMATAPPPPAGLDLERPLGPTEVTEMQTLERTLAGAIFGALFGSAEARAMLGEDSPQMRRFWELKYRRAHELGVETPQGEGALGRGGDGGLPDLTDAQRSAIDALRTGPSTAIEQPGHTDGLREMSLGELHEYTESWNRKKESLSELGEEISTRLQIQQDRRAKAFTTLSNLLKKWSDTSGAIIANLK